MSTAQGARRRIVITGMGAVSAAGVGAAPLWAAARDGDMKYLKVRDNTFLFNVVNDPLERANWKAREPEVFKRMEQSWEEWETTMLPIDPLSSSSGNGPVQNPDRPGNTPPAPGAAGPGQGKQLKGKGKQ